MNTASIVGVKPNFINPAPLSRKINNIWRYPRNV
jgi:hypothetical protein